MPKRVMAQSTAQNRDALLQCHLPGREVVAYKGYKLASAYIEPGVGEGRGAGRPWRLSRDLTNLPGTSRR
jgi:hypothetical protein